jgi:hypothetical protein
MKGKEAEMMEVLRKFAPEFDNLLKDIRSSQ